MKLMLLVWESIIVLSMMLQLRENVFALALILKTMVQRQQSLLILFQAMDIIRGKLVYSCAMQNVLRKIICGVVYLSIVDILYFQQKYPF